MSYSFTVRGENKNQVKAKIVAEITKVVESQPIHVHDRQEALSTACAFVDLLPVDDTKDVSISVNGTIGWSGETGNPHLTSASISLTAALLARA